MSRNDAMRDPFYAPILYSIERKLFEADRLAALRGIVLTDSAIRSLLVRAINEAQGKPAKTAPGSSPKDQFLHEAFGQLALVRAAIEVADEDTELTSEGVPAAPQSLPAAEWIVALETVKSSCALRTTSAPGSRGYLDFLPSFFHASASQSV
jgi:hypothetical protein